MEEFLPHPSPAPPCPVREINIVLSPLERVRERVKIPFPVVLPSPALRAPSPEGGENKPHPCPLLAKERE